MPAALLGVLALAIAVRAAAIGSRLTVDEAYSWLVASAPSVHAFLHRLAASENTPPLFYLSAMAMPGDQPAWLRVPAAVPGVLICLVLFTALRPRLGARAALLTALIVAVCPFAITYADLARGFMLADLGLVVAAWMLLALAERETAARWAIFWLAGTIAIWSEYSSAICVGALVAVAVWIDRPRRRHTLAAAAAVLVTIAPWIPEIVRGQHQVGMTKFEPMSAAPSLHGLRDILDTLTLGENGGTSSTAGRWLVLLVLLGVIALLAWALRRHWDRFDERGQRTIVLTGAAAAITLAGHAVAGAVGIDVFSQRYLTILIPLAAVPLASALVTAVPARRAAALAGAALAVLGIGETVRRFGAEYQPDLAPARVYAASVRPRTVLTNTPLVLYYLRSLHPVMDRPYNLGAGQAATCARPCLIVDDTRVPGGTPRAAAGPSSSVTNGPFVLTLLR